MSGCPAGVGGPCRGSRGATAPTGRRRLKPAFWLVTGLVTSYRNLRPHWTPESACLTEPAPLIR
jgi:hypothetical protein